MPVTDHFAKVANFLSAHVVELQHDSVGNSAINASLTDEILAESLAIPLPVSFLIYVAPLVVLGPML